MTGAIFLDRDGVINRKPPDGAYVGSWGEFEFLPGAVRGLRELARRSSRRMYVVTNQRGIALGLVTREAVDEIHALMTAELRRDRVTISGVRVCPHEIDTCECRKPQVGLFQAILADDSSLDLKSSSVVGDTLADVEAAHRLGIDAFVVGPKANAVAAEAQARGMIVSGIADSLKELVASGALDDGMDETETKHASAGSPDRLTSGRQAASSGNRRR